MRHVCTVFPHAVHTQRMAARDAFHHAGRVGQWFRSAPSPCLHRGNGTLRTLECATDRIHALDARNGVTRFF